MIQLPIPTLTTARLRLRAFDERDVEALAPMLADPEVTRYIGDGKTKTRAEVWRQIASILGHWVLRNFGLWAVEEKATSHLVGWCGHLQPEGWPGFEVGYLLGRPYWGRGYARESAAEALRYAREELGRSEIISLIRPANTASIQVATALGASLYGNIDLMGAPADIYRYPPPSSPPA